jgi:RNA-directed DNA polymerase
VYIPKPGSAERRPLGIPAVRDRVVQAALRNVIEPIFEREFARHSYGFRPGLSAFDALRRVERLLNEGFTWVVDVDLRRYFDTIPHDRLMGLVGRRIADGRVLELIEGYLRAGVLEEVEGWQPTERGTPQGAVISPLLANIYLDPLDHLMEGAGMEMTRYADDMLIQCRSREEAEKALGMLAGWAEEAGLSLHPEKTRIVDATLPGGFDFLGYHFERGMRWPRKKSIHKLREAIVRHTPRNSGQSMATIIARINPVLRGWFTYFRHSKANTFETVDQWVRGRLRSILRRRARRRGRGRGYDHHRWPNVYFEQNGLYLLKTAWSLFRQSRV